MKVGLIDVDGKYVNGYEGRYVVSKNGDIYSLKRNFVCHGEIREINKPKLLKCGFDKRGYKVVNLYDGNGGKKNYKVHRLVAMAFLENKENKRCVCHKDNNPKNCNVDNLYWGTDKENQRQAWEDGLHKSNIKISQHKKNGKLVRTFFSSGEAQRITGIHSTNIWKCLHGKRKTAGGYLWKRLD